MLWELPTLALVVLNVAVWLIVHLATAFLSTSLAPTRIDLDGWLLRERRFEAGGELYQRLFRVTRWKRLLPDGAALFKKGFRKKRFASHDPVYLQRFARETGRAELAHWAVIVAAPLFFLWNPPWAGWVMIGYATLASLPFIVVQRYNRHRLRRLLATIGGASARATVAQSARLGIVAACRTGAEK